MGRLTPDQLDEVRRSNPIVQVVESAGFELTKRGKHFWRCCPFHDEDTPSFAVDDVRQRFNCYGCGAKGDVIAFLMKAQGLDFRTAVQKLIDQAGLKFDQGPPPRRKAERDRVLAALTWAQGYFARMMHNAGPAREYARGRGLWTKYMIDGWGIGFGPADRYPLIGDARQAGFSRDDLLRAGLIGESEPKKPDQKPFVYNRFTNRLVFPIRDNHGQVRGFAGRALDADNPRKYINSAEGEVFQKARLLFGMERLAKSKFLKARGYVLVAEGYTDVLRLHWLGYDSAVAPMGTSITSDQVNLIARYTQKVILILDGDAAGIQAAVRAVPLFLAGGVVPYVVIIPDGLDPDAYIMGFLAGGADGKEGVFRARQAMDNAIAQKVGTLAFMLRARLGEWGPWDGSDDWTEVIHRAPADMLRAFYKSMDRVEQRDDLDATAKALFVTLRDMAGLQIDRRDREVQAIRTDIGNQWEDRQMLLIFRSLAPYERERLLRAGARLIVHQERHAKDLGYPKPRQPWPDPAAIRRGGGVPGERK